MILQGYGIYLVTSKLKSRILLIKTADDQRFQFVDKRGSEWSHSEPLFDFLLNLKPL